MSLIKGSFTLPTPQRTSQLVNDTRFSSIREYFLDGSVLSGSSQLDISDLLPGSVIYRIDLIVVNAFSDQSGAQHDIEITCDNGGVQMAAEWNDPNNVGTYTTNCYTSIRTPADVIHVVHSLGNILTGSAVLRFYIYSNIDTYSRMLTSDNLYYHTMDKVGVDVRNS